MKTIDQFMWSYQHIFRTSLELGAKTVLSSIGATVAPKALLVGFEEEAGGHPICVEPEGIGVLPSVFEQCMAGANAAYQTREDRQMFITDRRSDERFQAALLDKCRTAAVADAMNSHVDPDTRRWHVGPSATVGRYRVYPAIGVLRGKWDELPSLTHRNHDHRSEMHLSLQEAVMRELLQSASFALEISDEPTGIRGSDQAEVVRRATRAFLGGIVYHKGYDYMGGDLDSAMNLVAAQPYEGRTGVGTMLMAAEADYLLELAFENPISLTETRALRKALEMTDPDLHLVTNGRVALGLGRVSDRYSSDSEAAFSLRVIGRGSWELEHAGISLLSVIDGSAFVPRQRLDRATFDDVVERLFSGEADVDRLWSLALAASRQAHGTMLVVHAKAHEEAARLSPPAMRVEPGQLSDSTLLAVSAIDGAIIVDPLGRCHAIGAILDGRAAPGLGDASRGARFNSAHRYLAEAGRRCLIIIVSEDGMLNLIPDLPRRVKRSYVESVLVEVERYSQVEPVDFETFHKREEHLRSLAFYLTPKQCTRANDARERVEEFRQSSFRPQNGLGGITRVEYAPIEPNPQLDDTFFLEEGHS